MRRRLQLLVLPLCALSVSCRNMVATPRAQCAGLIPRTWSDPIPGASVPDDVPLTGNAAKDAVILAQTVNEWAKAFVAQSGQLSKANGRTSDAIQIFSECERLVNAARPGGK